MIDSLIDWIKRNTVSNGGIIVTSKERVAYPEVTGYFIPLLSSIGEHALAADCARWLTTVQIPNGSFCDPSGSASFAFDTGQVVRGWVSILPQLPEIEAPLRRACDWLIKSADPVTGRLAVPAPGGAWSLGPRGEVSEAIHLYVLGPLRQAGKLLNEPLYVSFSEKSLQYYLHHVDLTTFEEGNALTHFYGYVQEALVELGYEGEARKGMASAARYQRADGAVPAYHDVSWVCSPGLAQLAKVWFMLGERRRGDKALQYLASLQNPGGGFFGSYGAGAQYFPDAEISWAAKYVLEAVQSQIVHHFNDTVGDYSSEISPQDGRVVGLLRLAGDLNSKKVLDAGGGKGRYSAVLKRLFPEAEITVMDISAEMLRHVPSGIKTVRSGIVSTPFQEHSFDLVFCVEALEHVVHIEAGIRELARVLAPGGQLVIIDKNVEKLGALEMPQWEKWFGREELLQIMHDAGMESESAEYVGYDRREPDGLFIMWHGRKKGARIRQGESARMAAATRHDNIRTFNPQILLGDRQGLSLYCLFVEEHLQGGDGVGDRLYRKFLKHFNEDAEHSANRFRALIDAIRSRGVDASQGVWANPQERTLIDGSHRCAIAIVTGLKDLPYHLRFGDNRTPDQAFKEIFSSDEVQFLLQLQERLIQQCSPTTALQCRVRKVMREFPGSFSAPFSSKTRMDAIRLYQGFEELELIGKRPVGSRFATYGINEWVRPDMEVLEIGCNNGFLSLLTARHVAHVTAFDADPAYIKIGKLVQRHLGIGNCDLFSSPFGSFRPGKQYDAVFACAVHGWLNIPFQEFVSVILASLKPGGIFLFETHELDCHPEAAEQRAYLLDFFEVIRHGFIDDADPYLYQSEFREYLVLRRKPCSSTRK